MPDERLELWNLVRNARAEIEWMRDTGIEVLAGAAAPSLLRALQPVTEIARDEPTPPLPTTSGRLSTDHPIDFLTHPGVRASKTLPELRAVIGDCQRCKLAGGRTNIVFGVGNPEADLVFVGEAPGQDEDATGEPFVGRAGQLLTEIIVKGMKIRRQDVYIANIIKCRPPQNRNPEPDEIAACEPFLKHQLALIRPKAIVTLGSFAAQCLLKTRTPITRLRGMWANYQGVPLMPTFHPAYLLRNPSDKRLVWQDIQQVMTLLGLR
jgi:uracil-DNA glycosylase family 4